jgi:parallel beta-helix repeat protein
MQMTVQLSPILADGVTLHGFQVRSLSGQRSDSDAGILVFSNGNLIKNNTANLNGNAGIILNGCKNNTLQGNEAIENRNDGIVLINCTKCIIENNLANQNRYGIRLEGSNNNTIVSN